VLSEIRSLSLTGMEIVFYEYRHGRTSASLPTTARGDTALWRTSDVK